MAWAAAEWLQHVGHVRASGSTQIGRRGLEQFGTAIMRPVQTSRAIPRVSFQGNEMPGAVATGLRLAATDREPPRRIAVGAADQP
jgi:hypothetical protein